MLNSKKLVKSSKLTTTGDFQRVYKNAKRYRHHGISMLVCQNNVVGSRIGISISKKQIPRAIDRNRIKRIIRETFRLRKNELSENLDVVFLVYSTTLELSNQEIRECLDFLWTKLMVFYKKV